MQISVIKLFLFYFNVSVPESKITGNQSRYSTCQLALGGTQAIISDSKGMIDHLNMYDIMVTELDFWFSTSVLSYVAQTAPTPPTHFMGVVK